MKTLIHKHNGQPVQIGDIVTIRDGADHVVVSRLPNRYQWLGYGGDRPGVPYAEVHLCHCFGVAWDKPWRTDLSHGQIVEHEGLRFRVEFDSDDSYREPWKECDGHGVVSDWTTRDKRPGEIVINSDRDSKRYYDWAESIKIAKRDRWDAPPYGVGTKGEQAVRAVKADYKYLKAWCDDEWNYQLVTITCLDEDGNELLSDSLGGVESYKDYHEEMAWDMIEDMVAGVREKLAQQAAEEAAAAEAAACEQAELHTIATQLWALLSDGLYAQGWTASGVDQEWAKYRRLCAKAGVELPE